MRHVLVAVDDSEASERAAEFVNRFFGGLDVSITAVNIGDTAITWSPYAAAPGLVYPWPPVWGPMPSEPVGDGTPPDAEREAGERTIESTGLQADHEVIEFGDDVAEVLGRIAAERGADLIVVGSGHKGTFEQLISPSVSKELAKAAPVPVLVVH